MFLLYIYIHVYSHITYHLRTERERSHDSLGTLYGMVLNKTVPSKVLAYSILILLVAPCAGTHVFMHHDTEESIASKADSKCTQSPTSTRARLILSSENPICPKSSSHQLVKSKDGAEPDSIPFSSRSQVAKAIQKDGLICNRRPRR